MSDTFLGRSVLELGPCRVEVKPKVIDWDDESGWISVGNTDQTTWRRIANKADLVASQTGTRPDNKVIVGQQGQLEFGMGQATAERLELVVQDIKLEKTGPVVNQLMVVNKLGEDDRSILFWVRATKIFGGILSVDPLDQIFALAAPMSETIEEVFDAATQRFVPVLLEAYFNDAESSDFPVTHSGGEVALFWTKSNI